MSDDPEEQPDSAEKSLGDKPTGPDASRAEEERSLGNQSTSGDAGDSATDVGDIVDSLQDEMEIVDLSKRYQIEGTIGKGGMGEVLRARDTRLDRPVAIKRVLGDMLHSKKALARFLTEAKSIAALNHFNIVQIHDYGRDAEGPFIIMELVEGESLQEKLTAGPLELAEAINLTCQLCDGLAVAHDQGIIHRDIKPANILLTETGVPKLTDFGLARQETADHGQTQAGALLGTIDFMAPEQRSDATAVDARSDLWALAATFYQMVTGKGPKVIRLDQIPSNLAPVIGKMLEDDPKDRYKDARTFKQELQNASSRPLVAQPEALQELHQQVQEMQQQQQQQQQQRVSDEELWRDIGVCAKCKASVRIGTEICPRCNVRLWWSKGVSITDFRRTIGCFVYILYIFIAGVIWLALNLT